MQPSFIVKPWHRETAILGTGSNYPRIAHGFLVQNRGLKPKHMSMFCSQTRNEVTKSSRVMPDRVDGCAGNLKPTGFVSQRKKVEQDICLGNVVQETFMLNNHHRYADSLKGLWHTHTSTFSTSINIPTSRWHSCALFLISSGHKASSLRDRLKGFLMVRIQLVGFRTGWSKDTHVHGAAEHLAGISH